MAQRKAVILLSGGLDSATVLAIAQRDGFETYGISFDYGQRHRFELQAADRLCDHFGVRDRIIFPINLRAFGGSALTDNLEVPKDRSDSEISSGIPLTYVPARNTIFLSIALGWAEVIGARDLFLGVNAVDYSGYPDCRPEYIDAWRELAQLATKSSVEGNDPWRIHAPLIEMTKAEIIRTGTDLGVDYSMTHSCYDPDEAGTACGHCDSCGLRKKGFLDAGLTDPIPYQRL